MQGGAKTLYSPANLTKPLDRLLPPLKPLHKLRAGHLPVGTLIHTLNLDLFSVHINLLTHPLAL